jgi:YesN/AraC family two-component response regulator
MPEMNGKQLAELIMKENPELKVLYISGYTENVISHHGILNEGVNFLNKPFTANDLLTMIGDIFEIQVDVKRVPEP